MADVSDDYEGLCDCVELKNVKNIKLVSGLHTFALKDKSDNFCNGFKSYLFKSISRASGIVQQEFNIGKLPLAFRCYGFRNS